MEPEDRTQIFIVRIWNEPREVERSKPEWRGMVEHVRSGQQRYFKHLDELLVFMLSYVEGMGVKVNWRWQLRHWLKR